MLLGTIRQFIVVGMVAPCVFIGSMVVHLAEHPELQAQLRADPGLIPAAVEEYLRLLTPYRGFARTPTRDVEIGGRLIRKDEPVALVYASANRDESRLPRARASSSSTARTSAATSPSAPGPHRCAGAPLATLMLRVTLEELLARTSSIELAGEVTMTGWPEWGTLSVPGCGLRDATPSTADFDPLADDFAATRTRSGRGCATDCPVARGARWDFWALTRYDDIVAASSRPADFTSSQGIVVPKNPVSGRRAPLHFDPPEHPRYRRPLNAVLAEERVAELEPRDARARGRS